MANDERMATKSLLSAIRGALDRHVKQRPRDAIIRNAIDDPAEPLVQRVTENDACDFCSRFANGKPVNPRDASEKFHQFCKCHFMLFFQETKHRSRFVNDGKLERIGVTIEDEANPDDFEKYDAMVIAALGRRVEFLKPAGNGPRIADTLIDGEIVEFKNPSLSNTRTVRNQILNCLYGKNREVIKPQSDWVLISNVKNGMSMVEMQESLAFAIAGDEPLTAEQLSHIRKVTLLDVKTQRLLTYDLKNNRESNGMSTAPGGITIAFIG